MNKVLHTKYGTAIINFNGYYQIGSKKEGNYHKYLHRLIFEDFYNFEIPKNYVVHHKDGNKLNNCILNLQLINNKQHTVLHMKGENHFMYGKKLLEEHKKKISETNKKKYARIIKYGVNNEDKQNYCIMRDGKSIKYSIFPTKLLNWFTKEYPTEILQIKINN